MTHLNRISFKKITKSIQLLHVVCIRHSANRKLTPIRHESPVDNMEYGNRNVLDTN